MVINLGTVIKSNLENLQLFLNITIFIHHDDITPMVSQLFHDLIYMNQNLGSLNFN